MRIAFHGGTLRGFGSGLVGRNVLEQMAQARPDCAFLAWVPESWRDEHGVTSETSPSNVELRFTEPGMLNKVTLENRTIRRELKAWGADALFSAGDTSLVACPVPHLLLIHQANLAYGPSERGFEAPARERVRWAAMDRYLRMGLPSVDRVTVQTRDMADRLSERFGFDRDRIVVIPSAVERLASVDPLASANAPRPYVVYVASAARHKNFEVLPAMMSQLRTERPDLQCRLTLEPDALPWLRAAIEAHGLEDQFVFEGHLPRERALGLLKSAEAMVMPSWLESFGLPYYEAMMLGVPVVAADRGFAREACGEAGLYADPSDPLAFASSVMRLVQDQEERQSRSKAVLERFEETAQTWQQVAGRYLEVLEELASP
ncbi:MAG: hypothetical protein CL940_03645 [Deltaproteobacteria bacterium]|nr:hypothetical protein [Deltaproteobacteria bacterium]